MVTTDHILTEQSTSLDTNITGDTIKNISTGVPGTSENLISMETGDTVNKCKDKKGNFLNE